MAYAKSGTLVASTVTTVTLDAAQQVTVVNRGTVEIWFTTDGTTATVAGNNCYCVAGGTTRTVKCWDEPGPTSSVSTTGSVISLISTGTPGYEVDGL